MTRKKYKEPSDPNITLAYMVAVLIVIGLLAITIPISDKQDLYVKFKVTKNLFGTPAIQQIATTTHDSTLIKIPSDLLSYGSIYGLQSGDVHVLLTVSPSGIRKTSNVGILTSGFDVEKRVLLPDISKNDNVLTLILYEDGNEIERRNVQI